LIANDRVFRFADHRVGNMVFCQTANPQIDIVHVVIHGRKICCDGGVAGDLVERCKSRKAHSDARLVQRR